MTHKKLTDSQRGGSLRSLSPASYVFTVILLLRLILLGRLNSSAFLIPSSRDMQFYNDWARRILNGEWTDRPRLCHRRQSSGLSCKFAH